MKKILDWMHKKGWLHTWTYHVGGYIRSCKRCPKIQYLDYISTDAWIDKEKL